MLLKPLFKSVKQTKATDQAAAPDQLTIPLIKLLWPQVNKKEILVARFIRRLIRQPVL